MKRSILLLLLLLTITRIGATTLRTSFQEAMQSYENAKKFYAEAQDDHAKQDDFLGLAYKGAASITLSKFEKDRAKKKQFLQDGIIQIEESIQAYPENIELRLIRLIIQENLPKFIKYNQNIEEDKTIILSNYNIQESDLKDWIKRYIQQSKSFTPTEQALIL